MKSLLTAILALTLVPCASYATAPTTPVEHTEVHTKDVHTKEVHEKEGHKKGDHKKEEHKKVDHKNKKAPSDPKHDQKEEAGK